MSSKNHRSLPTDSLWRPSIHDSAPSYSPPEPKPKKKQGKKAVGALSGRYLIMLRNREPDKKHWQRKEWVAHCCRVLGIERPLNRDPEARLEVFRAYARHRGYKLTNGKKARMLQKADRMARVAFYDSREWLTARYKALKLYGRKCMACGRTDGQMHVDHIKPRSKYPTLELEVSNLQVLCRDCNMGKGAWDETDWRPEETEQ